MPVTSTEAILTALHVALDAACTPQVLRNEVVPHSIPAQGLVVLRDGDPGKPSDVLGARSYDYDNWQVEIEIYTQSASEATRRSTADGIVQEIATVLFAADRSLGGLIDHMEGAAAQTDEQDIPGGQPIKRVLILATLQFSVDTPLT